MSLNPFWVLGMSLSKQGKGVINPKELFFLFKSVLEIAFSSAFFCSQILVIIFYLKFLKEIFLRAFKL